MSQLQPMHHQPALIVGGGPAGLASAIALRQEGLPVTLVELQRPPVDKACGEGIMPDGMEALRQLGVQLAAGSGHPFTGIRYVEDGVTAVASFSRGEGRGLRRSVLHATLVERAAALGVRLLWGRRVLRIDDHGADIDGGRLEARWIIGADGLNSPIRRQLELDLPVRRQRLGLRRHYAVAPWSSEVEVHWARTCEAYVTPVAPGTICIAILTEDRRQRFDQALAEFPRLAEILSGARALTDDRGAATSQRRARAAVRGNVALVGDASGSVDAITGSGVTLGFHQALLLAASLREGRLDLYAREHRRLMRLASFMSSMMLTIHRRPWLRLQTLRLLQRWPRVFAGLLSLHTRALPHPRILGPRVWETADTAAVSGGNETP